MSKNKVSQKNESKKNNSESVKVKEIKYYIISVFSIVLILITLIPLGVAGQVLNNITKFIFGNISFYYFSVQLLLYFLYILFNGSRLKLTSRYVIGSISVLIGIMLMFGFLESGITGKEVFSLKVIQETNVGLLQVIVYGTISSLFGKIGTYLFAIAFLFIGVIIYYMISISTHLRNGMNNIVDIKNSKSYLKQQVDLNIENNIINRKAVESKKQIDSLKNPSTTKKIIDFFSNDLVNDNDKVNHQDNKMKLIHNDIKPVTLFPIVDDTKVLGNIIEEGKEEEIIIEKEIYNIDNKILYELPSFDLLNNPKTSDALQLNRQNANEKAKMIVNFLKNFNLDVLVSKINIGPSITKFELTLAPGIRVNKIVSMADDIKMALAVKEMRIEAPIPGKSAVGIEIPNVKNTLITLKEVLNDINYEKENKLVFGLGKDINGRSIYTSLDKMPHLLVAGSTGSGKSVCINSIIVSLLMNANYDEVRLLLIDPKKVELGMYNNIPHLLGPVVSDPKAASVALRKIVEEMDRRYQILADNNCKNINGYNGFVKKFNKIADDENKLVKMPYIVVIIDELADLMMVSAKEVEESIMRITQMARAAGIHLIVATQRPSTDVITGVIKANIPSRIAFAVSSSIDSRTILDSTGAEKLLGKGDMFLSQAGTSGLIRVQGAYLSEEEVLKVVYDVSSQQTNCSADEIFSNLENEVVNNLSSCDDEIYFEVEEYVKRQDKVSTSQVQRHFKIGYNRAARLIEELESVGIISAQSGSKPREVLIKNEELE